MTNPTKKPVTDHSRATIATVSSEVVCSKNRLPSFYQGMAEMKDDKGHVVARIGLAINGAALYIFPEGKSKTHGRYLFTVPLFPIMENATKAVLEHLDK